MQLLVTRATDAMNAVRKSSAAVTGAIAQLGEKSDQIGGIVRTITAISEQTNLLERAHSVTARMGDAASVAESASASAEQVSASTQQTSASAQEIAASASMLADTAQDLAKLVGRFRLTV